MFSGKRFSFDNIPDLSGKVAIVTGGNTGIGFVTARELARKNAHVFVASRSKDRGEPAVELIKKETKNDAVEFLQLDLQSLNSVKLAAETFLARNLPLHILNGHHRAPPTGIEFEKLNDPNAHNSIQRYGQSKLANILFTIELNKRLSGTNVYCNSLHPGAIKTELTRGIVANWGSWTKPIISIIQLFLLTPDDGALTQLYCATSPEIEEKNFRGKYFVPFGEIEEPSAQGKDEELAKKLWDFSENLIKEKLGDDIFSKCYA
ncbi:33085_t:CDS:2 [Gigaspora margarita]|uniref:33085_t:CDS:1 n=1 Tax=Gigaspora margarita TaxID=4874 RepID=A0ABN7VFD2_GIGMA|nr:33085_t:CDS:2 [Gigaspora margarita]